MNIIILGTGSPEGHPIILHPDEYVEANESRLRNGLLIEEKDIVLVDCGPDIRQQLIQRKTTQLNALFITHQHFDHLWGIGDIAQLKWLGDIPFKVYVNLDTKQYIEKFIPWTGLQLEVYEFDKEYAFKDFVVIPREVKHSNTFKTAAIEIIKDNKAMLYAPDFKGFESYNGRNYEFTVIDGAYYLGKYLDDNDHLEGQELDTLIKNIHSNKNYLIAISPWWYKMYSTTIREELNAKGVIFPDDYTVITL